MNVMSIERRHLQQGAARMEEEGGEEDHNVLELSLDDDDFADRLMGAWWPPSAASAAVPSMPEFFSSTRPTASPVTPMKRKRGISKEQVVGSGSRCINLLPRDEEDDADDEGLLAEEGRGEHRHGQGFGWATHVAGQTHTQQAGKRARVLEEVERPQLFSMWLKMKSERRHDEQLQALVDALVLPEDLYHHFREFVPPGASQAEADRVYMRRLQYERECAERALVGCKARSWLLRRSSLNRRAIVLRVTPFGMPSELSAGLSERLTFAPNEPQRPLFYAFSYSLPGSSSSQPTIAHVLIMKWKNMWARCDCDDGVVITPTFFSTSFIAVLDRLLDSEGLRPDRMVLGYLSSRS